MHCIEEEKKQQQNTSMHFERHSNIFLYSLECGMLGQW